MDQLFQAADEQGSGHLETEYFQTASGGARAPTDKREVEEQHDGEAAPERVITQGNACGGHHRGHIDRNDSKRIPPGQIAVQAEPGADREPDEDEKPNAVMSIKKA